MSVVNPELPKYAFDYLGEQKYKFPLQIQQLNKYGDFNLNWKFTESPKIHDGMMDLSVLFDIGAGEGSCTIAQDYHNYQF